MLTINERFENLLPPLSAEELALLEASIRADGVREPVVIWNNIIIDGHNRYKIATRYDISFSTVEKTFEDEDAACIWIIENQLGKQIQTSRHKLTNAWKTFLIGGLYHLKVNKRHTEKVNQ